MAGYRNDRPMALTLTVGTGCVLSAGVRAKGNATQTAATASAVASRPAVLGSHDRETGPGRPRLRGVWY